jgi:hypothetical protein
MNRLQIIFVLTCFMTGLFSVSASAKWSLLEDYQLCDIAGDEGLCLASIKKACDFDILEYTQTYPYDELNDDMNESMIIGLERTLYDYSRFHHEAPFPVAETTFQTPVPGDPFFQSDWFSPGFPSEFSPGWDSLYEDLMEKVPPR